MSREKEGRFSVFGRQRWQSGIITLLLHPGILRRVINP
jgi:hypothetical protein